MVIKDLFESVKGLPDQLNVIDKDGNHLWVGNYQRTPEEIKMLGFKEAYIKNWGDNHQIIFYI